MEGLRVGDGWMDGCSHLAYLSVAAPVLQEGKAPSQPRLGNLTASHITSDSIQLEWSIPEGTFDSFTVQYRDAQGQPESLLVDGESHTVTVPGLSPSHRYNFYLYAVSGQKRLGPISLDTITAPAPQKEKSPSQPRLGELMATHVTPESVQLEWSVPEGTFDSFTVQYKDAQGQPQVLPVDGGLHMVTVPGLSPSQLYKFNLYGVWGQKRLGPISTDAVTGAPGTLWVGTVWPRSARLHWAPPRVPPDGYDLVYGPPGGPQKVTPPVPHPKAPRNARAVIGVLGPIPTPTPPKVFQRRQDGGTDFWRGWEAYAHGFGNVTGEFWLGNDALHALTAGAPMELRVDLRTPWDAAFARYRDFAVAGPEDHYRLHLGAYSGTAGRTLGGILGGPRRMWESLDHFGGIPGINWFPWKGFEFSIPFTEMKLRPQRD
ncbi:PREDICTED: tenascin-X-like [Calidris pugnax]|uniref:tenascin-X-like n=1 Tax=Calidris pugnax TaxID=198806 RepID=UPI00071DE864|nr:PREDICTED: tenascin-X-like [Calidris pugnax]